MRIDADPDPKLSFTPRLYTEISINFLAELDTRQQQRDNVIEPQGPEKNSKNILVSVSNWSSPQQNSNIAIK